MTFNVEIVNGDLDAVVNKLGELQKNPAGSSSSSSYRSASREAASRRTETPEAGALKTPVSK